MRDFGLRGRLADAAGVLLPLAELATATALVLRPSAQWGGLAALVLLLVFMAGIGNALRLGVAPDCHCFGQIQSSPAGRGTLVRNGVLAAGSAVVLGWGPGSAIDTWVNARSAAELVAIAAGACAVVLGGLAIQYRGRLRQLGEELGMAQRMAAAMPPGLPVGSPAPSFSARGLGGEEITLDAVLEPGLPSLLVFVSPSCGSCMELMPKVVRWQKALADRLRIALISSGTAEDNREAVEEYGLDEMLLQERGDVLEAYRIRGTPSAVLVTATGEIGSAPGEMVSGIEPLIRVALREGLGRVPDRSVA
jgi:thiol-disulfide isomerase/thioredoxin